MNTVPFIAQSADNECGLACIAMISGYYGLTSDIAEMRSQFRIPARGMSLSDLRSVSSIFGLTMRALHLDFTDFNRLYLPAIMHWKCNHFVVLTTGICEDYTAVVLDPGRGMRKMRAGSLLRRFSGFAIELRPSST